MDNDTLITLIVAGLALFVWVPAIIWSVHRVLKQEKKTKKNAIAVEANNKETYEAPVAAKGNGKFVSVKNANLTERLDLVLSATTVNTVL